MPPHLPGASRIHYAVILHWCPWRVHFGNRCRKSAQRFIDPSLTWSQTFQNASVPTTGARFPHELSCLLGRWVNVAAEHFWTSWPSSVFVFELNCQAAFSSRTSISLLFLVQFTLIFTIFTCCQIQVPTGVCSQHFHSSSMEPSKLCSKVNTCATWNSVLQKCSKTHSSITRSAEMGSTCTVNIAYQDSRHFLSMSRRLHGW